MFKIKNKCIVLVRPFPEHMSTKEAIKKSIKKWQFIYDNIDNINQEAGGDTCALCYLYSGGGCFDCPIMEDTDGDNCQGTPWWTAHETVTDRYATKENKQIAVQLEIDYLKEILSDYLEEHNEI